MSKGMKPYEIKSMHEIEEIDHAFEEDDLEETTEEIPAEVESTGPETKNGIVEKSLFVNVRKEASFDSDVIDVLRRGDIVTILGKEGNFYKISTKLNKVAYISSDFVEEV